jgi:Zn ribbon nucleic-acid-binding protein
LSTPNAGYVALPTFDAEAVCSKCGHDDIGARWHVDGWQQHDCGKLLSNRRVEHLHRHCRRCGHEWAEAPLDSGCQSGSVEGESHG